MIMHKNIIPLALMTVLIGTALSMTPVVADSNLSTNLKLILNESNNQVNQKMQELQDKGIVISAETNSSHAQGLEEYNASLKAIDGNDIATAKNHALTAMSLFKKAIESMNVEEENHNNSSDQTNDASIIVDAITNSENYAQDLKALAASNNVIVSFTDYDTKIDASKESLISGNLQAANEQLATANTILEQIHEKIQTNVDAKKTERVKTFVNNTIADLDKTIIHAKELGLSQSIIDELQNTIERLRNASTYDEIISQSDQSSNLQNTISDINNERIQNFDKEFVNIRNHIRDIQTSAEKFGINLQDVEKTNELLSDIKQKIANGQAMDANEELDEVDSLIADMEQTVNTDSQQQNETTPQQNESTSQQNETTPQQNETTPQQNETTPQQNETTPQQNETLP